MNAIKSDDEQAYKWLMDSDPTTYSCHLFDPIFKSNHVMNNMIESWNGLQMAIEESQSLNYLNS